MLLFVYSINSVFREIRVGIGFICRLSVLDMKSVYIMCFNSSSTAIGKQNHARCKTLSRELD